MKHQKYSFSFIQKVAWGDMDAYGHINHLAYGKYFETARGYYFNQSKIGSETISNDKENSKTEIPIISHFEMSYRKQVFFPSDLEVTICISNLKKRSFDVLSSIWNDKDECVVTSKASFLWFNKKLNRPTSIPEGPFMELKKSIFII